MKKLSLFLFVLFSIYFFSVHLLFAENVLDANTKDNDTLNIQVKLKNSPYSYSNTQETIYLGVGISSFAIGFALQNSIDGVTLYELSQLSKNDINKFDRFAANYGCKTLSNLSDYTVGLVLLSPTLLLLDDKIRQEAFKTIILYSETMLYAGAIPMITKKLVTRFRPYSYNNNLDISTRLSSDTRASFFSAHTCVAFASAVFLSSVFSDFNPNSDLKTYIWVSGLSAATFVAYLRVASGYHFLTDVISGAVVGSSIGYLIPYLHKINKNTNQNSNSSIIKDYSLFPIVNYQTIGINLNLKF
jgi:membrane-associated phospholipid phosphatase